MITGLLIAINILVFYFCNMQYYDAALNQFFLAFGLNEYTMSNPLSWVTSMFIHGSAAHIGMNMFVLLQCGIMLEKNISKFFYLFLYFICGLSGSFASVLFIKHTGASINVIGASGAIFGLLAYASIVNKSFSTFLVEAGVFHAIIYFLQLPIAWFAHLGGAIMGLILALIFGWQQMKTIRI